MMTEEAQVIIELQENKASKNGGAVFRSVTSGGTVSCLFENNTAAEMGGAIFDTEVRRIWLFGPHHLP